jgi:L-rhamnose-H+ transport protein
MNPFFGVFLHSVGGFSAGSFYIPFRKVRRWAWESYWLVQGVAAWIFMPVQVHACHTLIRSHFIEASWKSVS